MLRKTVRVRLGLPGGMLVLLSVALAGDCTLERGVYLLTMSPGDTVQNIFGHTAVLVYDPDSDGFSPVYDYGHFEEDPILQMAYEVLTMTKPYFMGSRSLADTVAIYGHWGRGITAQRLQLTPSQQANLALQLSNDLNSDLSFDYNWYRPNCTTMIQERLNVAMGGALQAAMSTRPGPSPAGEVLRHSGPHVPLWFGLHWGSGGYARTDVDGWSGAFLPDRLMTEAAAVSIEGRKLVSDTCVLGRVEPSTVPPERRSRDGWLWGLGLLGAAGIGGAATRRGAAAALVGVYGLATGLFGATALLIAYFGTFAPFWGSHNLAFASPLNLVLLVAAWMAVRSPVSKAPMSMAGLVAATAVLGAVLGVVLGHENIGLFGLLGLPSLAAVFALRPTTKS